MTDKNGGLCHQASLYKNCVYEYESRGRLWYSTRTLTFHFKKKHFPKLLSTRSKLVCLENTISLAHLNSYSLLGVGYCKVNFPVISVVSLYLCNLLFSSLIYTDENSINENKDLQFYLHPVVRCTRLVWKMCEWFFPSITLTFMISIKYCSQW
jgi:hypothetical protein